MKYLLSLIIGLGSLFSFGNLNALEENCGLTHFESSLGPLTCEVVDQDGDCPCYAKKYKSLLDDEERLNIVKRKLGGVALRSIKESFAEVSTLARELSLNNHDFMSGGGDIVKSCRLDNLSKRLSDKCDGNVNQRIKDYFGDLRLTGNKKIESLTDLSNELMGEFRKQLPLRTEKIKNEKMCLSKGEGQRVLSNSIIKENQISNDLFQGNDGLLKPWSQLSERFKYNLTKDPLLKLAIQNDSLRTQLQNIERKSVLELLKNKSNLALIEKDISNKCETNIQNISKLICSDPLNSNVENIDFNREFFNYDVDDFENEFDSELANELISMKPYKKLSQETFLEGHVAYCVAKMCNKDSECRKESVQNNSVDSLIESFTYETGYSLFRDNASLNGESDKDLGYLNKTFCPLFFCKNSNDVITTQNKCEFVNPPNSQTEVQEHVLNWVGKDCDQLEQIDSYDIRIFKCNEAENKIVTTDEFKAFLEVMNDKLALDRKQVLAQNDNTQAGSTEQQVRSSSDIFEHFVENFEGGFGKLVEERQQSGKEITVRDIVALSENTPVTVTEFKQTQSETQSLATDNTVITTKLKSDNQITEVVTDSDKKIPTRVNKDVAQQLPATQKENQVRSNQTGQNRNDGLISIADHNAYMAEVENLARLRERMSNIEGQIKGENISDAYKRKLESELEKLTQQERNSSQVVSDYQASRGPSGTTRSDFAEVDNSGDPNQLNNQFYPPNSLGNNLYPQAGQRSETSNQDEQVSSPTDESGIANLPSEGSVETAEQQSGRSLASTGGVNLNSAVNGASAGNNEVYKDLPYSTDENSKEAQDVTVIQLDELGENIDLAKLFRKEGIELIEGSSFILEFGGHKVRFSPIEKLDGEVKYKYAAKPLGEIPPATANIFSAMNIIQSLAQATYWTLDTASSNFLKNTIKNNRSE